MSKTIRDRGISTFTLPSKLKFSFDVETRKIELAAYFKYCAQHNLLISSGEQSRISLIRKTFNNMGGSGATAEEAMRDWLQTQTSSSETDLNALWKAYFLLYSTTPDMNGVTYAGLSVESGYRKFLYEFIGLSQNYYDPVNATDNVSKKLGKVFSDNQAVSDMISYILGAFNVFSDNITATSAVVLTQKKSYVDTINQSDSHYKSFTKVISEGVAIQDVYSLAGTALKGYQDTVNLAEVSRFHFSKVLTGDSAALLDSIATKLNLVYSDSIPISDNVTVLLAQSSSQSDSVDMEDVTLIILNKVFTDTITASDTAYSGYIGFGAGVFSQYLFSA